MEFFGLARERVCSVLRDALSGCHPPTVGDPERFDDRGAPDEAPSSGVFVKRGGHAGATIVERVLRSADEARRRGDPFRRWRRLGAPPEWQQLSVAQRRAIEVMIWGTRALPDDSW